MFDKVKCTVCGKKFDPRGLPTHMKTHANGPDATGKPVAVLAYKRNGNPIPPPDMPLEQLMAEIKQAETYLGELKMMLDKRLESLGLEYSQRNEVEQSA